MILTKEHRLVIGSLVVKPEFAGYAVRIETADWAQTKGGLIIDRHGIDQETLLIFDEKSDAEKFDRIVSQLDDWRRYW